VKAKRLALDAQRVDAGAERVALQRALAQGTADASRHAAAVAYCQLIAKRLDRLDDAGRRDLLRRVVDRVAVSADAIEVQGTVFPADGPVDRPPTRGGKTRKSAKGVNLSTDTNWPQSRENVVNSSPLPYVVRCPLNPKRPMHAEA
jgi:hypothetical protein